MEVKCKYRVICEEETLNRVNAVLTKTSLNKDEYKMVEVLEQIIYFIGSFSNSYDIPKIIFEIMPENNIYPIYNTLARTTKVNANVTYQVIPNKSTVEIVVKETSKLPDIPDVSNITRETNND